MSESDGRPDIGSLRIDRSRKYRDRPRRSVGRWIAWAAILAALVAGYFALREFIQPTLKVRTAAATLLTGSEASADLVATGYVVAQRSAEVASKGTGRLARLDFEEGDRVRVGQVIAELDNADIRAQREQARAELQAAEVDTLTAGRQHRRVRELFASGAVTQIDAEGAESAYLTALARLAAARAALAAAEVALENTYIHAPFDGTILTKNADVGEIVAPFASSASSKGSVVTLADMNSLEVEADVSESNIQKIVVGRPAEIVLDAYPAVCYPARVKKIVPTADRARATVLTKVAFDSLDSRVLPEMSARVSFFLETPAEGAPPRAPVLVVPKDALTVRDGRTVVFVVGPDNYVAAVPIDAGRELNDYTEVKGGLTEGAVVVLDPPGKLQTGRKVEITY
ncbi:MAG TPA: efflux RND transporter periplasmic adaptor subunit [candidate division Zixibacteria bacterium]|nr:efflux RND transporter periplasmic adaptor subunit [candidate division Zixibacteria bacterium]MDD4918091.1 efflux RND transporter periplasmic adaptor subunit [candidate division Zixibacteria bacterium]MDM7972040.1 efflux RND transporter periplasmic adaptor subunit [candidate division Zixibacteria bacterium]HOD66829.1 efflux RND transporter periplasmic adaptor subunit [candidate division Zixibacteria bacterium]HPI32511.1 efflux RND transporter periplasmic adaptor subunit [candidate division Z